MRLSAEPGSGISEDVECAVSVSPLLVYASMVPGARATGDYRQNGRLGIYGNT
jgi:hypothetical protein